MVCWRAPVGTALARASSRGEGQGGRGCIALAVHAEEREEQVRTLNGTY